MSTDNHTPTEKNSWLAAKAIFEKMLHLGSQEMYQHLTTLELTDESISDKVIKLIVAMDKNKTLFNQTCSNIIFNNMSRLMDLSGSNIDSYQLEALIAVGGMSSVYRANRADTEIQKPVAIKVMQPHQSNESMVSLFKQEQRALSQLSHPNIVTFLHGDKTPTGVYYLVMEYITKALTLDEFITQNSCDTRAIVVLIKKVAIAVAYAHSHLVIHKDLKAANMLVDQHGAIKVIDFGIAALDNQPVPTQDNIYTPNIASPEQIKGLNITSATDVFSLSATLLGLLIEVPPLPDFEPNSYSESHDEAYITSVLETAHIDHNLKAIIAKGLQTKPDERYPTMDALAQDLSAWLAHRPISILQHKISHRLKQSFRRNPLGSVALSLLLVAVMLAGFLVSYYAVEARQQAHNSAVSLGFLKDVLSQSDPSRGNPSDITIKAALQRTLEQQKDTWAADSETNLSIMTHLAEIYSAQSMYNEAAEITGEIYKLHLTAEGPKALSTLQAQKTHAEQLRSAGDYQQSIKISNALIEQLDESQTVQANIKLSALSNIAGIGIYTKDLNTRQNQVQQVMDFINKGVVNDDELISRAWLMVALLAEQKSDINNLHSSYQKALHHNAKAAGKQHPSYANIMNSYAVSLTKMGYYEQAQPLFIESIELARKYDDKGLVYGRNLLQYATMLFRDKQREQALSVLEQSLPVIEATDHLFTQLIAYETSYRFNKQMRDFSNALNAAISSTQKAQVLFKSDDYPYFKNTMNLAEILVVMGEFDLAQKVLELLLVKPIQLEQQHVNSTLFRLGLIAWLSGDHGIIKNHHILNQNTNLISEQNLLVELFKAFPASNKQHANQKNIFTNERELLETLIATHEELVEPTACQFPATIKSRTDLVLLKIITEICADAPNRAQNHFFKTTGTADQLEINSSQYTQIEKILNQ